ncbi:MAG: chromosome segregation protein SMC [Bdellovibrionales bacterium]
MQFTRLRIRGFKSFVEPTNVEIPPGMTGIVGPNGCGKSNLVEALRWVMGENSPRRMRGSEMDDVIFAGTATRPSHNIAEVALHLDNTERSALAEFNNDDELQVARVIERGSGSDYRINGRPVRQRDVQLLFADQATGAHSTNLVGQGQIDALIRAKPQDRRQILEEASGTAGLQARRHEAELKLKAADQNILRVDDVLRAYDTQLRSLKQQVRQASRYRNLAEHIRRTEAALLHLRWLETEDNAAKTKEALQASELRANELLAVVTRGNTARAEIAAELPGLRQADAAAAAIVQKLTIAREQIEAEEKRVTEETHSFEQRLAQAKSDREREEARREDGQAALGKLDEEQRKLADENQTVVDLQPHARQALTAANAEVEKLDAAFARLVENAAAAESRRDSLQKEIRELSERCRELAGRRYRLDHERAELASEIAAYPDLSLASALVDATQIELARKQQQARAAEQASTEAGQAQSDKRERAQEAEAKVTKLKAEADTISAMLHHQDDETEQVIDLITVTPGLEYALAVALGEALTAGLDPRAVMHWRELPPLAQAPALPRGIASLAENVQAPPALARALSQVGLVENAGAGESAAAALQPGQVIVSRDGWAWRWDGFTVTPQAKTATAMRMRQRNRLAALEREIAEAEADAGRADEKLREISAFFAERQAEDKAARVALQAAFAAQADANAAYAAQEKQSSAIASRLLAMDETLRQIARDQDSQKDRALALEHEQQSLPDLDAMRAEIAQQRDTLAEKRTAQAAAQRECDRLAREQTAYEERRASLMEETNAWRARINTAEEQIAALADRMHTIDAQLVKLRVRPAELAAARARLLNELSEAEAGRKTAADRLIEAEQKLHAVEHQLKQDEAALSLAREERVRGEGAVEAAAEQFNTLRERMTEKLNCGPDELAAIANFAEGEMPNAYELDQALTRYLRERENMGPVNLRAEAEAETVQGEIDKLQAEKDDLNAAIAKLRQGIGQLNREARERLQNAFTLVNERFQNLFKRLFEGGKAHLELIDDEDPLNAGLEIFASPPGKKMQILSLLSGGERTLTALALLFAVFQTNPSPICVLDEAEAALDESNIDRFCRLVEDIARETGTRFLIITHQRLTMARMDRLYGVTMSEKGVSQLVSVDLAGAVALRDGQMPDDFAKAEAALEAVKAA